MRNATQKEIDKFIEYRANHVALVQRIGKVVFDTDLSEHDKDKIEANGEELNLFALRNSMLNGTYHPHRIDKSKLNSLTGKHVKSQKHHPEYWDDSITARNFDDENPPQVNAHKMPKKYLLEMCCDWSSCALYRNTPMFSWYNKTCTGEDARFLFTDNQKEYIIECISRIAFKIKEENLHYPNVDYTAEADSPKIDFGKKLNESKEDVIYSKEFKEWFGDWENDPENSSKVVDKDGKPLVVYHGSYKEFDTFKSKGMGIHFGTKQASEDRLSYTADIDGGGLNYEGLLNKRKEYAKEKGIIYPCFLNIKNPFIIEDPGNSDYVSPELYYYLLDYGFPKEEVDGLLYKEGEYLKDYLISKKFDGIFYNNEIEDKGSISYIVFYPNQIKSAISNNGNFSKKSNSIYEKIRFKNRLNESKEDIIYSKEFKNWFGDWENDTEHSSKVIDKDGKPLAVYHGSFSLFDSFDPDKGHNVPAIWHADRLSIASHWSNTSDIHRNSKKVSEDFESLKSLVKELESKDTPFEEVVKKISTFTEENLDTRIESRSNYTSLEDCKEYNLDPEEYEGISYGYDIIYNNGMEMSGNVKKDLHKYYKIILEYVEDMIKNATRDFIDYSHRGFLYKNYLNIRKPLIVDAKDEPYHNIRYKGKYYNTESLAMYAKERGYDGVIVRNVYETDYENKKGTDYIVFNPNQIKSATDNNGNFSKESDNMYEKILHKNNKWVVTDHTGKKNLGTYDTKEEAEKRLKQVEYFKHINESLIDSNNFKKWFGNSVVKDNEGNPLILYHGTPSTTPEITEFDSSKASNNYGEDTLIYATDSKEMAEFFSMDTTEGSLNFTKKLTGNKGKVYPLYMRLEHPMDFRNLTDRDIEALTQAYIEYKRDLGESKDNIEDIKNKYKEEIKKDFEFGVDFVKDRHLSYLVHPKYIHIFKEYGYDGIICPMREQEGIKDALEYAVISPNQIKSIDNQGTFSLQSNNIYEKVITSFGGKVPISNKDKDQILKFCKKAVEDGMEPTKYTEEEMVNSSNLSSGSISSNTPENNLKIINLGSEELIDLNEAYVVCNMDGSIVAVTYTTDLAKAKEMRKDLADKYRLFFQLKRVKDKEEKIEESTSKEKTCVFTFGRYQPPTKGHLKVWETLANTEADAHYIYTSHTKDKKKNPLDYNTKINLIEIALNENGINAEVVNSEAKTIIDVVSDIANKGFTDIIFVGGSDRLDDMVSLIKKYNDYPNKDGKAYHFNSISGISAGDRDPDSDSMEGISGTKIRQFALDGNYEAFKSNLAISDEGIAKELMKIINSNLK